jgi:hypothetical protein
VFQYNPETLSRTLTAWKPDTEGGPKTSSAGNNVEAQPRDPVETITLSLELDAADAMEDPLFHPSAAFTGVADRIAAIEILMYPTPDNLVKGLLSSVNGTLSAADTLLKGGDPPTAKQGTPNTTPLNLAQGPQPGSGTTPVDNPPVPPYRPVVPIALLVLGAGTALPVRITSYSIEEQAFLPNLYPLRAKISLGLQVVDAIDFTNPKDPVQALARIMYQYNREQKQALAIASTANNASALEGVIPFM